MNMSIVTTVLIGDRVRYESAAGTIRGEVVGVYLSMNAAGTLIPWLQISRIVNNKNDVVSIAGTEDNLKMMQFRVIFRDGYRKIA
jgi:hypothetical protein